MLYSKYFSLNYLKSSLNIFSLMLALLITTELNSQLNCDTTVWIVKNNIVVIEPENIVNLNGWTVDNALSDFRGKGYIVWKGAEYFNNTNNGKLTFQVYISEPGTYGFDWRAAVTFGTSFTEHNDTWLNISNADDFYAVNNVNTNLIVKPKPVCNVSGPNVGCPNGSGLNNYFKIYGGRVNTWQWQSHTSDNDPHKIFFRKDKPGRVNINIAARSSYNAIDRIVCFKLPESSLTLSRNLALEETKSDCTVSTFNEEIKLNIYPNPVGDLLHIEMDNSFEFELINLEGKVMLKESVSENSIVKDISQFEKGIYFLKIKSSSYQNAIKVVKL